MPDLDTWIHEWILREHGELEIHRPNDHQHSNYHCYNPINLQSCFLGFDGIALGDPNSNDLQDHFHFIGLTTQFHKSVCVIFTLINHSVPPDSDCTTNAIKQRKKFRLGKGTKYHGG